MNGFERHSVSWSIRSRFEDRSIDYKASIQHTCYGLIYLHLTNHFPDEYSYDSCHFVLPGKRYIYIWSELHVDLIQRLCHRGLWRYTLFYPDKNLYGSRKKGLYFLTTKLLGDEKELLHVKFFDYNELSNSLHKIDPCIFSGKIEYNRRHKFWRKFEKKFEEAN